MDDIIVIIILAVIAGLAALYVYREKRRGNKCIGCPYGKTCAAKNGVGGCGCAPQQAEDESDSSN